MKRLLVGLVLLGLTPLSACASCAPPPHQGGEGEGEGDTPGGEGEGASGEGEGAGGEGEGEGGAGEGEGEGEGEGAVVIDPGDETAPLAVSAFPFDGVVDIDVGERDCFEVVVAPTDTLVVRTARVDGAPCDASFDTAVHIFERQGADPIDRGIEDFPESDDRATDTCAVALIGHDLIGTDVIACIEESGQDAALAGVAVHIELVADDDDDNASLPINRDLSLALFDRDCVTFSAPGGFIEVDATAPAHVDCSNNESVRFSLLAGGPGGTELDSTTTCGGHLAVDGVIAGDQVAACAVAVGDGGLPDSADPLHVHVDGIGSAGDGVSAPPLPVPLPVELGLVLPTGATQCFSFDVTAPDGEVAASVNGDCSAANLTVTLDGVNVASGACAAFAVVGEVGAHTLCIHDENDNFDTLTLSLEFFPDDFGDAAAPTQVALPFSAEPTLVAGDVDCVAFDVPADTALTIEDLSGGVRFVLTDPAGTDLFALDDPNVSVIAPAGTNRLCMSIDGADSIITFDVGLVVTALVDAGDASAPLDVATTFNFGPFAIAPAGDEDCVRFTTVRPGFEQLGLLDGARDLRVLDAGGGVVLSSAATSGELVALPAGTFTACASGGAPIFPTTIEGVHEDTGVRIDAVDYDQPGVAAASETEEFVAVISDASDFAGMFLVSVQSDGSALAIVDLSPFDGGVVADVVSASSTHVAPDFLHAPIDAFLDNGDNGASGVMIVRDGVILDSVSWGGDVVADIADVGGFPVTGTLVESTPNPIVDNDVDPVMLCRSGNDTDIAADDWATCARF